MTHSPGRHEKMWLIILEDILVSLLASFFSILAARWMSAPIPGFSVLVFKWLGCAAIATAIGLFITKVYREIRKYATIRSIGKVIVVVFVKELALVLVLIFGIVRFEPVSDNPDIPGRMLLPTLTILIDLLLTGLLLAYLRIQARMFISHKGDIKQQALGRSALVIGISDEALQLADTLEKAGYTVVGLLTNNRDMAGRVVRNRIVYFSDNSEQLRSLQWRLGGIDGIFFPKTDLEPEGNGGKETDEPPQHDGMSFLGHIVKRGFDIGLSAILLLIFSPVILLCYILVKREDGGPAIYAQERIGRGGKPFQIYKFRSMRADAEASGKPALYAGDDDPRLTRVGHFLRAHHLDELPQLWNVLKGDMSFIGYRPERQFYIDQIIRRNARYRYLYQIRPGVTSYATLYNGYTDTLDKMLVRLELDLYYLRNHSIWFDAKVLGLTFLSIVAGKKF